MKAKKALRPSTILLVSFWFCRLVFGACKVSEFYILEHGFLIKPTLRLAIVSNPSEMRSF